MTFEEAASSLPNGFHDAELQRFEMDYVHRTLQFDLIVWIGNMEDSRRREVYRPARLTLEDVAFLVIEPPDVNYPWLKAGRIRIDAGESRPPQSSSTLPGAAPAGTRTTWIYLEQMNTFLLFSAGNASLEWTGPEVDRP
jgi:hypothetical protein